MVSLVTCSQGFDTHQPRSLGRETGLYPVSASVFINGGDLTVDEHGVLGNSIWTNPFGDVGDMKIVLGLVRHKYKATASQ